MKRLIFSLLLCIPLIARAADIPQSGGFWRGLIPSHTKLQLAGGVGTLSAGVGWCYGKRDQFETDFLIGHIPKYSSDKSRATFTLKETISPWEIDFSPKGLLSDLSFAPLRFGVYANATFGDDFWTFEPGRYPDKYYKFSSGWRFHLFIGEELTLHLNRNKSRKYSRNLHDREESNVRNLSFYYELHTYDLMGISAFTNKELKFWDVMSLSFGIKYRFR